MFYNVRFFNMGQPRPLFYLFSFFSPSVFELVLYRPKLAALSARPPPRPHRLMFSIIIEQNYTTLMFFKKFCQYINQPLAQWFRLRCCYPEDAIVQPQHCKRIETQSAIYAIFVLLNSQVEWNVRFGDVIRNFPNGLSYICSEKLTVRWKSSEHHCRASNLRK